MIHDRGRQLFSRASQTDARPGCGDIGQVAKWPQHGFEHRNGLVEQFVIDCRLIWAPGQRCVDDVELSGEIGSTAERVSAKHVTISSQSLWVAAIASRNVSMRSLSIHRYWSISKPDREPKWSYTTGFDTPAHVARCPRVRASAPCVRITSRAVVSNWRCRSALDSLRPREGKA